DGAPLRVGRPDHRGLHDVRVGVDRGLDLGAADVVPGGDDHVVGAALGPGVAVLVPHEGVPGDVPAVDDVAGLPLVVEVAAADRAPHPQPPAARRVGRV